MLNYYLRSVRTGENGSLKQRYLLATCGNDNVVKLWHFVVGQYMKHLDKTPCELSVFQTLEGHTSALMCVRFSPGGNYLASSSLDRTVRIWEVGFLMEIGNWEGGVVAWGHF